MRRATKSNSSTIYREPRINQTGAMKSRHFIRLSKVSNINKVFTRDETLACLRAAFPKLDDPAIVGLLGKMEWGDSIEVPEAYWRACPPHPVV